MGSAKRPAVFLDRDGTLIDELGYLDDPDGVRLYPGAAEAVARLNEAGFATVLLTNQSGVARGLFDETRLGEIHARLESLLARAGARLDLILYCPHHPGVGAPPYRRDCECRKPKPGLFLEARRRLGLDMAASWAIGDARRDLSAARRAGVGHVLLVATGKGETQRAESEGLFDAFVPDLGAAVDRVLS